ncbi:Transmembrane protein [Melia azedarach]|uniref:Transmembrane protein n=1 Tax=Melia azedarach TaxID=155640 RepID=A0ACC1Y8F0_MELAZ|nr:Transmembrane protein [Melia azedarach]
MPQTLCLNSQFFFSKHSLLLNPIVDSNPFLRNPNFATKFPSFQCYSLSCKIQVHKPIVSAKRTKRRSGFQRSTKFMIQLISILACNLKILPQPLDLFIEEFNGGDGRGLGILKGFEREGFGWWRRRRRKGNLWLIVCLVVFGSLFLFLFLGRELTSDVLCGILSLGLFGIVLVKGLKKNFKNCLFGLCCFGALLGLALRREAAIKWINELKVCAPMVEIVRRGKSRGRRRSL